MPYRSGRSRSDALWLAAATITAFLVSNRYDLFSRLANFSEKYRHYRAHDTLIAAVVLLLGLLLYLFRRHLELDHSRKKLKQTNRLLATTLDELKVMRGILPICSFCKSIRNDLGDWQHVEVYIQQHTEAACSHSICPRCLEEHYPEYYAESLRQSGTE